MEKIVERYVEEFEKVKEATAGEASWLRSLRGEALGSFAKKGFPTVKEDAWRYTDLGDIAGNKFFLESKAPGLVFERKDLPAQGMEGHLLFFINGWFRPEISDVPKGILIKNMPEAFAENPEFQQRFRSFLAPVGNVFLDLNVALGMSGIFIEISANVKLDRPIHIVHWADAQGGLFQPKVIVAAGKRAKAVLIEDYRGGEVKKYFTNAFTGVVLEEGAVLEHYRIQQESRSAFHVAHLKVEQKKGSSFSLVSVALGAKLMRYEISAELAEEEAACRLSGLYLGENGQHFDHVTRIDHAKPAGKSDQLFKGILGGDSRGVFTGKVLVREGAQKTDAHQTNKNLLLSEIAKVDSRPQLEILADDVKCGHGAAVGQLDEDAVFYLRSRGIGESAAQRILAEGFAREVVEDISDPQWKNHVEELVSEKLLNIGAGAS